MSGNRPNAPLFATINVTGYCNLKCKYCFYQPRLHEQMPWSSFRRVISELAELQVFFVNLSGGEPFTHPEINKFLQTAHSMFRHVVVLTNGTILEAKNIKTISKIVESKGEFPIQVSLDAVASPVNRKTRSSSTPILNHLQILKDIGANIVVAMVITRFNARSIIESMVELTQYTTYFHLMSMQPVNALKGMDLAYMLSKDELDEVWQKVRELKNAYDLHVDVPEDNRNPRRGCACGAPCMSGFSQLVVDPSLRVRPCDRCVQTFVGDLNVETAREVWTGRAIKQVVDSPMPFCQRDDQIIL